MSIPLTVLQNIHKMLERVTLTGTEAIAWVEARVHLENAIKTMQNDVPKAPAPVVAAVQAALETAPPAP